MKKCLLFLIIILSITSCKKEKVAENGKPTIKIGVALPLSGEGSNVGNAARQAIELAYKKWQNKNTKYNYKFIFENDMLQPKQGAVIAQKFVAQDKVNAIISMWGIVAPVIADISQRNKVINLTCAGLNNIADPFYIFNNYTQYDAIGKELVKKLKSENVKSVVYLVDIHAAGESQSKIVSEILEKEGIKVLKIEKFILGTTEFRIPIAKLETLNPDYYVMFLMMPGTKRFIEQFKQVTGKTNIAAIDVFQEMPEEYWPAANDLWYIKSTNGTEEFVNSFKTETNLTAQSCTGNQYDNTDILIWAYENTPVKQGETIPNNEDVVKTLQSIKERTGAIGKFSIDDKGVVHSKATLMKMLNGKPVTVE